MPKSGPEVHPGEEWAYRKRAVDDAARVLVKKVGQKQPPRVLIHFVDDGYEGREEWVPPGRLIVAWADVESWRAREDRWDEIAIASEGIDDTPEMWAASTVFDIAASEEVLFMGWRRHAGVLSINDTAKAAQLLDVDPEAFLQDERAFVDDDGATVVPWTTSLAMAKSAAPRHADAIIREIEKDEHKAAQRAIYGEHHGGRKNSWYSSPEVCAEIDSRWEPVHQLLREWCGKDAADRRDELLALQAEVRRIGQLAERAITALGEAGKSKLAESLKRDLGVTIETIRASRKPSD